MKALVVTALSPDLSGVALADRPVPRPGPGEVLIRVVAAALNFPDLLMTRGDYQLKPPLPFVPGMEISGEVVAGDGFARGEAVVAATRLGGFAEFVVAPAADVRRKPATLDHATAAGIGVTYLTAYVALVRAARLAPGEWVLVHGAAGGVGMAAVDLAGALGARVIAASRSTDRLARLERLYPVDATVAAPGFRERVRAITGGAGADVVVDPVGGDTFDESTRCIAFGGRLLVVGFASGRIPAIAANVPLIKGFSVIGVRAGEYARRFPAAGRENADAVWAMAADGRLHPPAPVTVPLDGWRDAFAAMAAGAAFGKVVLTI